MRVALTGATGFLGRYILQKFINDGHTVQCWYRPESDRTGYDGLDHSPDWLMGDLSNVASMQSLVDGVDGVVHAALWRPGVGFRGAEGDLATFVERNLLGTIRLIEEARRANVGRFVFISTCAVHEIILDDRPLDEAHPLWATSHYGAHKAAIEKFIHSYGLGEGYPICALRPTGIYGVAHPASASKWYDLVQSVARGEAVTSARGGKEVHAADVAKAVGILLTADGIAGQAYNCYDMYIAEQEVAEIARDITGSRGKIERRNQGAKHQIETGKLRALGMEFGGRAILEQTIRDILEAGAESASR